jgi:outer membrane protein assembly factor BamD
VDATPDDVLAAADKKLADEDWYDAAELLEYFARSFPGNARLPLARLRLGDARFGLEEYVVARGQYQTVVADFPASHHVEEARFKIALCSYESIYPHDRDQSETESAIQLFDDFLRDYPESRYAPEAEEDLAICREHLAHREFDAGRFYEKAKRLRSAKIQFEFVLDQYPGTVWAPKACFRLGEIYRSRERWEDARRWYGRVVRDWPETEEARLARDQLATIDVARVDGEGGS